MFFHQVVVNIFNITDIDSFITDRKVVDLSIECNFHSFHSIPFNSSESLLKYFPKTMDIVLFQSPFL